MDCTRRVASIAVLVGLVAAGGAVKATAGGSTGIAGGAKVKVLLNEFTLRPSVERVAAGKVTFTVSNVGKVDHEFVVLKTVYRAARLPINSEGDVFERGKIAKIAPMNRGTTEVLSLNLARGHYALVCNLPGHYQAAQFSDFSVS